MRNEDDFSFASELLSEVKAQSKRWFIAFILMVILEAITVAWFTLPSWEEVSSDSSESYVVESGEGGNANYLNDSLIGGDLINGEDSSH